MSETADLGDGPIATFERLREAFFRYYDSPFGLQDERLQAERKGLLDRPGGVYQRPLIELRPQYQSTGRTLSQSVSTAGLSADAADFLSSGLIPPGIDLYTHQEESLRAATTAGRNVVVTAGTGSGKTEAFLLPVLANMVEESKTWQGSGGGEPSKWWAQAGPVFAAQRRRETGRHAAVRTIILYPMNALVDDQLIRLRKALDSEKARAWLDHNRRGHRFYFGRYTGATPVTGAMGEKNATEQLRRYLSDTSKLAAQAAKSPDENQKYFVPRYGGAEMLSRWDMMQSAPDILITNYSMLNIMLQRDAEAHLFAETKAWLFADPSHKFTLVVDELHSYRGTAGTEVALLIRNLKHRLGITRHPDKLRILAASASLDASRDRGYLEDFFGVDADTFDFLEGDVQRPTDRTVDVSSNQSVALENAFWAARDGTVGDRAMAKSEVELAAVLFGDTSDSSVAGVRNLLARAASDTANTFPRLRSHMFFRNVTGMWACTDPACSSIPGGTYDERTVGRLFAEPRTRCDCGARVLELLYCQNCGDVLLGGFTTQGQTLRPRVQLLADVPELDKIPDRVAQERSADNYLVYWPRSKRPELDSPYSWTIEGVTFEYHRSKLEASTGELSAVKEGHSGWSFRIALPAAGRGRVGARPKIEANRLSAMPTRCPNCSDDWEIQRSKSGVVPLSDPLRLRSPIRGMRTGFEKINQVLITELVEQMPADDKKLIVFTDSRQDAAKLSSGISLRHYQDLIRILLHDVLSESQVSEEDVSTARRRVLGEVDGQAARRAVQLLRNRDADAFHRLRDLWDGLESPSSEDEIANLEKGFTSPATLEALRTQVRDKLLVLGVNPAGPKVSLSEVRRPKIGRGPSRTSSRWPSMFEWRPNTIPRVRSSLDLEQATLISDIEAGLREEFLGGLVSSAGRDFESLGLGWIALKHDRAEDHIDPASDLALARASLRVLADMRRFDGIRYAAEVAPRRLRDFWAKLAAAHALDPDEVKFKVESSWGATSVRNYLIQDKDAVLRAPGDHWWVCATCRRPHLHRGAGLCTRCSRTLPHESVAIVVDNDYYGWKASQSIGRFRLNAAELTGQTDKADAQSRQARFQGVFLDDTENEIADGVDLLSVTTTMEAGVDIGALEAVVLGNMPPSRFNYQQRVGRAGRRGSPVAVALTVCRGRSHDEYYFDRPSRITNDPTPKPYLALDQESIFLRSLTAESLRVAFDDLALDLKALEGFSGVGTNTHGQFGSVASWPVARQYIAAWLTQNGPVILAAAEALSDRSIHNDHCGTFVEYIQNELADKIDMAVAGVGDDDLSQRLAEHGLLPMFGFPSKVRNLYLSRPTSSYPWPPKRTIDRDSAMAVSQFAPMSELVRDGSVYPAVGVGSYKKAGPKVVPEKNPLGLQRLLDLCRNCSYIEDHPDGTDTVTDPCPRCGAEVGIFETVPLHEPIGYVAGAKRDFDGNFTWSARATSARAVSDLDKLSRVPHAQAVVYAGEGFRYVINDRAGKLFEFKKASASSRWDGTYLSVDAVERDFLPSNSVDGESVRVALGSVQPTDLMFIGGARSVDESAGLRFNLDARGRQQAGVPDASEGRRAAWYSLAFLIRTVAAAHLDIQPSELNAGIFSGLEEGEASVFAFIADTLENGAGFSTFLGSKDELPKFMQSVAGYLTELAAVDHADACTSSCYRCLRDYNNMSYHALLDWRLADELFTILNGGSLHTDLAAEKRVLHKWVEGYDGVLLTGLSAPVVAASYESRVYKKFGIVVRHPFEAAEANGAALIAPRLERAFAEVTSILGAGVPVFAVDSFVLDRSPAEVFRLADLILPT